MTPRLIARGRIQRRRLAAMPLPESRGGGTALPGRRYAPQFLIVEGCRIDG